MSEHIDLKLRVNGREVSLRCAPSEPLSLVLRRELRLFGVRETCSMGVCGACTVLLDGRDVTGCLLPAVAAEGHEITTVEGLDGPGGLHPVQRKFVEKQAFQCSYCTPGFVLATIALLADGPPATAAEVREALGGCMCRCASYEFIEQAVLELADEVRRSGAPELADEARRSRASELADGARRERAPE
ncbi:(2Fe-2S)-binding protein [Nonomuraea sp. NPDC005650]|uniref:(2Fe-2S)-binding protein n=1 Tax=Nonomuraea sp. NPDC005650 TaxID=3157045 RepID=UPI0033A4E7BA